MITLHDATAFHEGRSIGINSDDIVDYATEAQLPIDGTRVVMNNGDQLIVQESVEEILQLIEQVK